MNAVFQYPWDAAETIAEMLRSPSQFAPQPNPDWAFSAVELRHALSVAFFASLLQEEGRPTRVSIALTRGKAPPDSLIFESRIPFSAQAIRKLAPAANPLNTDILVSPYNSELSIIGLTSPLFGDRIMGISVNRGHLRIYSPNPGVLHLERNGIRLLHFEYGHLTLHKDKLSMTLSDVPFDMIKQCLEKLTPDAHLLTKSLLSISKKMVNYGHGGTILLASSSSVSDLLTKGSGYAIKSSDSRIFSDRFAVWKTLCPYGIITPAQDNKNNDLALRAFEELSQASNFLAHLTQIDGAVILSENMEILHIGGMVQAETGSTSKAQVLNLIDGTISEGLEGVGARHRAAVRFCASIKQNAIGFVASQDGTLSIVISNRRSEEESNGLVVLRYVDLKTVL